MLAELDTVTSAMASALIALARDLHLRRRLVADPEDVQVFVEEIVQPEPPAPVVPRVTTAEVTIGGVTLPEHSQVRLCLGAFNRGGPDEISTDAVVMDGRVHRHWGFRGGPHRCLGSYLARLELSLIITEWLRRVAGFHVADGFAPPHFVRRRLHWPSRPLCWVGRDALIVPSLRVALSAG
ncbi:cytochrome P450 family protein [Mycobacterium sp. HUMS_1102779]|uniref:hypothetical protein n=1 Tax=Mycobacterium sp. HUMS_1102779 TaxID=3383487 RepID=UPI00389A9789